MIQMTHEYEPHQLDGIASILSHEWADSKHIDPWDEV